MEVISYNIVVNEEGSDILINVSEGTQDISIELNETNQPIAIGLIDQQTNDILIDVNADTDPIQISIGEATLFSSIKATPTTLGGYGITDAYTQLEVDEKLGSVSVEGYNNTNWDSAFSWGNHANAGYLTALVGYNNTNWDTAYTWGNHADAGYLTSVGGFTPNQLVYSDVNGDLIQDSALTFDPSTKTLELGNVVPGSLSKLNVNTGGTTVPTFEHSALGTTFRGTGATVGGYFYITPNTGNQTTIGASKLVIEGGNGITLQSRSIVFDPSYGIGHGVFHLRMNGAPAMVVSGSNSDRRILISSGETAAPQSQLEVRGRSDYYPSMIATASANPQVDVFGVRTKTATTNDLFSVDGSGNTKTNSIEFNKLNLSNLPEASDDADALAKGVDVGYAYINSTTGAVHKRII